MRTETQTVRVGEDMGPIDWAHPLIAASRIPAETLRRVEAEPQNWKLGGYSLDSGRVISFRMYDGWPYWEPRPAFLIVGPLGGGEWIWLDSYGVNEVYRELPPLMVSCPACSTPVGSRCVGHVHWMLDSHPERVIAARG